MLQVMYETLLKLANKCDRWPRARATMHMELRLQDVSVVLSLLIKVSVPIKCVTFDAAWLEGTMHAQCKPV